MARILTIEDEENLRFSIRRTLAKAGHEVSEASCPNDARDLWRQHDFDLVLTDVMLGSESGIDLVRELRTEGYDGVIVVMTAFGTVETAVAAMRDGADDYLQKPLSMQELILQIDKWLEHRRLARRVRLYERLEQTREQYQDLIGRSAAWLGTLGVARRLARIPIGSPASAPKPTPGPGGLGAAPIGASSGDASLPSILLLGETGVGKGVLARYIHSQAETNERTLHKPGSGGVAPPFVHVNCSALPATLVESELFGHDKGAFTDAREARPGLFEMADGGTIFLDEISEMPLDLQSKLLLVVEHGAFRRVGGSKERSVRARVITASNQDLEQRVQAGSFRRDLLYRLNAFTVRIPPLRERQDDAMLIAEASLERLTRRYGRAGMTFSPASVQAIRHHLWPGNVRELVNAVQRAAMLADQQVIEPPDLGLAPALPTILAEPDEPVAPAPATEHLARANGTRGSGTTGPLVFDFASGIHTADDVERTLIMQALEYTKGNVSRAAKLIGMQRSSLRYRIKHYHLDQYITEVAKR